MYLEYDNLSFHLYHRPDSFLWISLFYTDPDSAFNSIHKAKKQGVSNRQSHYWSRIGLKWQSTRLSDDVVVKNVACKIIVAFIHGFEKTFS